MSAPRLEINLNKIHHNAHTLVSRLATLNISVTGVTKAVMGSPELAKTLLNAGVAALGDSRIENVESLRSSGIKETITLIRSPMLSHVSRVARYVDISFNTEMVVIRALSSAAEQLKRTHSIILMVELGDLREGIMPNDLENTVREVLKLPYLKLKGIGANLACRSGVTPDDTNMAKLSAMADAIELIFGITLDIISGGNSANLNWALTSHNIGRINNLRLGESILLGCEPMQRLPIKDLHIDAITLIAEVIESKIKPSLPWGKLGQTAFGENIPIALPSENITQSILAIGEQDTDPSGLKAPKGITILGASSDHLIVYSNMTNQPVGSEVCFQPNYSAMLRAITSPFVKKVILSNGP